jgi:uncharacterized membrane protein
LLAYFSLFFAASACTKTSDKSSPESGSLSAKATQQAGANAITGCSGTEPFWSLKIGKENIEFASLGDEVKMGMKNTGAKSAQGSSSEYIALYQGKTLEGDKYMNVIIQRAECSDHMSEDLYPYTVQVLSGSTLYTGCCRN